MNVGDFELQIVECIKGMFNQVPITYDFKKLEYNKRYRNIEFFEDKFPEGYDSWFYPAVLACQQESIKRNLSPLDEILARVPEHSER